MINRNTKNMAMAVITGSEKYKNIYGRVGFKEANIGVIVTAEIKGLPYDLDRDNIFAFHIHEGESCSGTEGKPFADAKLHLGEGEHPKHMGDMPPLFSNKGYAYMSFLTDRFSIDDILGKTVIIHKDVDDFVSQPSGNAGEMIACGKIVKF